MNHVGTRLGGDQHDHRRAAVEQAQRVGVLHTVHHLGHVFKTHRSAVAVSHHQALVVSSPQAAIGRAGARINLQPRAFAVGIVFNGAARPVGVGRLQRGPHVFHADAQAVQGKRNQLHPHRRQRAAAQLYIANPGHLRDFLLQQIGHRVIHLPRRLGAGRERQNNHRCRCRVGLAVCRVAAQRGRQVCTGGVDGTLNFTGGRIDLPVQVKLQRDAGGASAAVGRDFVDACNDCQPAFQRRGHTGRHGFGAGPRQRCAD